jgi:hypothetical protein
VKSPTKLSRKRLLAHVSVIAAAMAPLATIALGDLPASDIPLSGPDPIFAVIAEHKAAVEACIALDDGAESKGPPEYEGAVFRILFTTAPTTVVLSGLCRPRKSVRGRIELSSYDPQNPDTANPGPPSPRPLAKAETFKNASAKQRMRELAVKYEELAERLEQAAADEPKARSHGDDRWGGVAGRHNKGTRGHETTLHSGAASHDGC